MDARRSLSEAYLADARAYAERARKAKTWRSRRFWEREAERALRMSDRFLREEA